VYGLVEVMSKTKVKQGLREVINPHVEEAPKFYIYDTRG